VAMLATLVLAASGLGFTALACSRADAGVNNNGAHGFAEVFYAYAPGTGNNGSAFAGITANTPWYNVTIGLAMLIGRFLMIIPLLAMAGALAKKGHVPASSGTVPTDPPT